MSKTKEKKKSKGWGYSFAWSTRGFALGVNTLLLMEISYYATESAGLPVALVGTLILVSKLFDGVSDLVAGFIIEKTHTRWGKARPYELFLIPTWVLSILLFSIPTSWGITLKAVYFFILYLLINAVCVTFLSSSEAVFLSRSTTDEGLRARALTAAGILATLFPSAVSIILPFMMSSWGTQPGGWTKILLVFAVPFTIVGLIRFFCIKELPDDQLITENSAPVKKSEDISLGETLKCLVKNKYIFIFAVAFLLCAIVNSTNTTAGTYFFTWYIGDLNKMSMVSMLGLISPFALLLFPLAVRKIGGMNFVKIGLIMALAGNVIKFFAGTNMVLIMIGSLIAMIPGASAVMMIGSLFVIQCMDYGEWKTGVRLEGPINAVSGFASKVGTGVASGIIGVIMSVAGYESVAASQSASAIASVHFCYTLFPAILCILMLIVLHFYDLEKNYSKIKEKLTGTK